MIARRVILASFALASGLSCASPPAPPPPPPLPDLPEPPATPPRAISTWRASPIPPSITHATFSQPTPEGILVIDESGGRWLFPADGTAPRSVEALDVLPLVTWSWDDGLGLVATDGDNRIHASKTALGPLVPRAHLPEGFDPKTVAHLDGIFTARGTASLFVSSDGIRWSQVPGLAGHDAIEGVFDGRGRGIGLFAPETVAITRDQGATWTPLATADLSVRDLVTFEGKPVLSPAGVRDRFERSVDLGSGALSRVFVPRQLSPEERRRAAIARERGPLTAKGHPRGFRRQRANAKAAATPNADPVSVRLELAQDEYDPERASTDGERALVLPTIGLLLRHPGTAPLVGKLGEGFVPVGGDEHLSCKPISGAICGAWIAVGCATGVSLYRADAPGESVATIATGKPTAVAFDAHGQLLVLPRVKGNQATTLQRYEAGRAPKLVGETPVGPLGFEALSLVGGCHKPALWAVGSGGAVRWEDGRFGDPAKLVDRSYVVGVDAERELVVTTPVARALTFLPSARKVAIGQVSAGSVSFTEDGRHALAAAGGRRVLASSDGGATFRPIPAPASTSSAVLCGKERCQLGMGAYRDGFEEDLLYAAPAAALPANDRPPPSPPPPSRFPTVMRCVVDRGHFQGVPAAGSGLSPRLGELAFSGLDAEEGTKRRAIFGDVAGGAKVVALPPGAVRRPQDERGDDGEVLFAAGAPGASKQAFLANRSMHPQTTTIYRWDAATPLRRFVEANTYQSALASPALVSDDAVAAQSGAGTLLIWGRAAPTTRPYPTRDHDGEHGVFAEDAAGTLRVAQVWGPTRLRLVVVPREGASHDRTIVARRHATRETAIGLLPPVSANDPWSVVLSELVEDEAAELRVHALGPDLSLGPPVIVPGTRAPRDHLMDLPSCGARPTGGIVRTFTDAKVSIETGPNVATGYLQRFLRVTPAGACVERTVLGHERAGLAGQVVVVGNGGMASSQRQAALRCEPVRVTPLEAAATVLEPVAAP